MKHFVVLTALILIVASLSTDKQIVINKKTNRLKKQGYMLGCMHSKQSFYRTVYGLKANAKKRMEIKNICNDMYIKYNENNKVRLHYVKIK